MEALIRENPDFAVDLTRYYCKVMRQLCFDAENQSISSILIRLSSFRPVHNRFRSNVQ